MSKKRYAIFLGVTLALPVVFFALVEAGLRLARPDGGLPLFRDARFVQGDFLVANPDVGRRWFPGIDAPPAPAPEPFPRERTDSDFLVFVLGESSAAGFPYPRTAAFSRPLRDALADVLPLRRVHVVNLGIAATNSFAMLDMADEVARLEPDAVLIYAGHNEYYGALGAASRVGVPGGTGAVRFYMKLLRLRTVLALRGALGRLRPGGAPATGLEAASLMEVLGRDRQVGRGSAMYERGLTQFGGNLERIVRTFAANGIPVLVASVASNLRDQPPFSAGANAGAGGATAVYDSAKAALGAGDSAAARAMFMRARDMDVIRFRAPGGLNDVVRRVAGMRGATYVPVVERFAAAAPAGIPGSELFLEHVHPNLAGYGLIARSFFDAMLVAGILGPSADTSRLRDWDEYARGAAVSPFDERVALHLVRTLTTRWPFVPVTEQTDYRATYRPTDLMDSLAFAVSRGAQWETAKLSLAAHYEQRSEFDSAAGEYAGLARDAPMFDEPLRLLARALSRAGREREAHAALRRAVEINPTARDLAALATFEVREKRLAEGIALYRRSLALDPNQPGVLYQLSLAYGMSQDLPNARATALRLAQISPGFPGLADWLRAIGAAP